MFDLSEPVLNVRFLEPSMIDGSAALRTFSGPLHRVIYFLQCSISRLAGGRDRIGGKVKLDRVETTVPEPEG